MFGRLLKDESGSVALVGAFSLFGLIGFSAFAVELGHGYAEKVENQRAADMAALGAAVAYSANQSESVMTATAKAIAASQGIPAANVVPELINSPAGSGKAVRVTVTSSVPLYFAKVISSKASLSISAQAVASLSGGGTACILALSTTASTGISANGNTSLTATDCGIASNGGISTVGSSKIVGKTVVTGGTISSTGTSSVTTAPTANQITQNVANAAIDPLAGNADLTSAFGLLGNYTAVQTKTPTCTAADFTLDYSPKSNVSPYWDSSTSTYTFPSGTWCIKNLKVSGGIKVAFQGPTDLTVTGDIDFGGNAMTIGDGPVNVAGTTTVKGDIGVTIGAGRHYFGPIVLQGGKILTIGAGNIDINGGIDLAGSSVLTIGAGDVAIDMGSSGTTKDKSIYMAGSSVLTFGDGKFSARGSIESQGGSAITFGATANHLINGNLDIKGRALFGKGRYTINGQFTDGTGGTTWPSGTMLNGVNVGGYDLAGIDVTFITAGKVDMSGAAKVYLAAPTSNISGGIANVLIANNNGSAFDLAGGATVVMTGAIYAPKSAVTMVGGSSLGSGGGCFMLIGSTITLKGGSAGATICPDMGGTAATNILLLQ